MNNSKNQNTRQIQIWILFVNYLTVNAIMNNNNYVEYSQIYPIIQICTTLLTD